MIGRILQVFAGKSNSIDPVCGMNVDAKHPPGGSYSYQGTAYNFCGPGCRVAFTKDPEGYLSGEKKIDM